MEISVDRNVFSKAIQHANVVVSKGWWTKGHKSAIMPKRVFSNGCMEKSSILALYVESRIYQHVYLMHAIWFQRKIMAHTPKLVLYSNVGDIWFFLLLLFLIILYTRNIIAACAQCNKSCSARNMLLYWVIYHPENFDVKACKTTDTAIIEAIRLTMKDPGFTPWHRHKLINGLRRPVNRAFYVEHNLKKLFNAMK